MRALRRHREDGRDDRTEGEVRRPHPHRTAYAGMHAVSEEKDGPLLVSYQPTNCSAQLRKLLRTNESKSDGTGPLLGQPTLV